jgi:hypothetical protein
MKSLTSKERENIASYRECKPKQLGNLHERMKLVVELMRESGLIPDGHQLSVAIYDLETEVSCYTPATPPLGQRAIC